MEKNLHTRRRFESKKGFTIFFAMLVGSLTLSIGFAIYDLTVREIDLSAAASQSQYAIYAADTGAECALYWDTKLPTTLNGVTSIFSTSSQAGNAVYSGVADCNGQDIRGAGTPPAPIVAPPSGWSEWTRSATANAATTTFTISLLPAHPYCSVVSVGKSTQDGILYTTIISQGYNNCSAVGSARFERTLRISY